MPEISFASSVAQVDIKAFIQILTKNHSSQVTVAGLSLGRAFVAFVFQLPNNFKDLCCVQFGSHFLFIQSKVRTSHFSVGKLKLIANSILR